MSVDLLSALADDRSPRGAARTVRDQPPEAADGSSLVARGSGAQGGNPSNRGLATRTRRTRPATLNGRPSRSCARRTSCEAPRRHRVRDASYLPRRLTSRSRTTRFILSRRPRFSGVVGFLDEGRPTAELTSPPRNERDYVENEVQLVGGSHAAGRLVVSPTWIPTSTSTQTGETRLDPEGALRAIRPFIDDGQYRALWRRWMTFIATPVAPRATRDRGGRRPTSRRPRLRRRARAPGRSGRSSDDADPPFSSIVPLALGGRA